MIRGQLFWQDCAGLDQSRRGHNVPVRQPFGNMIFHGPVGLEATHDSTCGRPHLWKAGATPVCTRRRPHFAGSSLLQGWAPTLPWTCLVG